MQNIPKSTETVSFTRNEEFIVINSHLCYEASCTPCVKIYIFDAVNEQRNVVGESFDLNPIAHDYYFIYKNNMISTFSVRTRWLARNDATECLVDNDDNRGLIVFFFASMYYSP